MAVISNIFPTYTYVCFDKQDQLQIKELNVFQKYIARNLLGFYKETHLRAAVSRAYTQTLQASFAEDYKTTQQLLRLFERAFYYTEYRHPLEEGGTLPNIRYRVEKVEERYFLKGIEFQIKPHTNPLHADMEIAPDRTFKRPRISTCYEGDRNDFWNRFSALNIFLVIAVARSTISNPFYLRLEGDGWDSSSEKNSGTDNWMQHFSWVFSAAYEKNNSFFRIYDVNREAVAARLNPQDVFSLDFALKLMQPDFFINGHRVSPFTNQVDV